MLNFKSNIIDSDRKKFKDGTYRLADNFDVHIHTTDYGQFLYSSNDKQLRQIMLFSACDFLFGVHEIPGDLEELERFTNIPPNTLKEVEVLYDLDSSDELQSEISDMIDIAQAHYKENIISVIEDSLSTFMAESMVVAMKQISGKGSFAFNKTETEVFNEFLKIINQSIKNRVKPKKESGRKYIFTPEEELEILSSYNKTHKLVRKAKKEFKKLKKYKDREDRVYERFPNIPLRFIRLFSVGGKSAEPSIVACDIICEKYSINSIEYLQKLLTRVRKL